MPLAAHQHHLVGDRSRRTPSSNAGHLASTRLCVKPGTNTAAVQGRQIAIIADLAQLLEANSWVCGSSSLQARNGANRSDRTHVTIDSRAWGLWHNQYRQHHRFISFSRPTALPLSTRKPAKSNSWVSASCDGWNVSQTNGRCSPTRPDSSAPNPAAFLLDNLALQIFLRATADCGK